MDVFSVLTNKTYAGDSVLHVASVLVPSISRTVVQYLVYEIYSLLANIYVFNVFIVFSCPFFFFLGLKLLYLLDINNIIEAQAKIVPPHPDYVLSQWNGVGLCLGRIVGTAGSKFSSELGAYWSNGGGT